MRKMMGVLFALLGILVFSGDSASGKPGDMPVSKTDGWAFWVAGSAAEQGGAISRDGERWKVRTPAALLPSGDIQIIYPVELEVGKTYLLRFKAVTTNKGNIKVLYNRRRGSGKNYAEVQVELVPGQRDYSCILKTAGNEMQPGEKCLRFYFGRMANAAIELSDLSIGELLQPRFSAGWKLKRRPQPAVAPDRLTSGADEKSLSGWEPATPVNNKINIAEPGRPVKVRDEAIVYNEFFSPVAGYAYLGCAADYWFEIYLNGAKIFSCPDGNGPDFTPGAHTVLLDIKPGRNLIAARVWSGSGGWSFTWGAGSPQKKNIKFSAGNGWCKVDLSALKVRAGSVLDLSSVSRVPRRDHNRLPRLKIGESGNIVSTFQPGLPLRLKGINLSFKWFFGYHKLFQPSKQDMDDFLDSARIQGYNLLRIMNIDDLCRDGDMQIEPKLLDRADYLLSQMGKKGIYAYLPILSTSLFDGMEYNDKANTFVPEREKYQNRWDFKRRMYLGDPEVRKRFAFGAGYLLNHVNPYTGVAWKDDPTIAVVEFYNEMELGLLYLHRKPMTEDTRQRFNARFRAFLKKKYGTIGELKKAWGRNDIDSYDKIAVPDEFSDRTRADRDFIALCNELSRECFTWCNGIVRDIGYRGLVGQYDLPAWLGDSAVRYEKSPIALSHRYFAGIEKPGYYSAAAKSAIGNISSFWPQANAGRFADRPFWVTETAYGFWDCYQHEEGILWGAYSALQGFDAIVRHSSNEYDPLNRCRTLLTYDLGGNPVVRASEFLKSCLWQRGDVKRSAHLVTLAVPESYYTKTGEVASNQANIGLLCGFALSFPAVKERPAGVVASPRSSLTIEPSGNNATVIAENWTVTGKDRYSTFSLKKFTAELRKMNILPPSNISNPEKDIFQSDTGEITLRCRENLLKVVTAGSEAVSVEAGKGERLGQMTLIGSSVPACVAVCAMDGKSLSESKRMVLIYSTAVRNTAMEVSHNQDRLFNWGRLPILMQTGTLGAELKNSNASSLSVYALGFDGQRREKLALKRSDSKLEIELNTATLKDGPTPFFELAAE